MTYCAKLIYRIFHRSVYTVEHVSKNICPRCHRFGYRSIEKRGNRRYIYYIHRDDAGRRSKCYVGPVGGYSYAERLHMLDLDNLADVDYLQVALNAVDGFARRFGAMRSAEMRREAVERFGKLVEKVSRLYEVFRKDVENRSVDRGGVEKKRKYLELEFEKFLNLGSTE